VNGVEQLCPNCGLCCDSTLFADVELQTGDDANRLTQLGLQIEKKARGKFAFAQSCACFDGKLCKIYDERPVRCRTFECGLLKKVQEGEMNSAIALQKISETKNLAQKVRELLRQLGNDNEPLALTKRYAQVMNSPISLADENNAEARGELMLTVHELMQVLQKDFLQ
jgi:Fe-S-cluster containining protein